MGKSLISEERHPIIQYNIFQESVTIIYMPGYFFKHALFFLLFFTAFVFLSQNAAAQSEEEMKVLLMFYREKDLVVSPTRHPKHISQVAENITVVTAQEIEDMNAHTVADVLNRIPGLFVSFNRDFGAPSLIFTQGSEERHVLVLVDGITWNVMASGAAETNSIPPGIIERIEVLKGPASSAWGSALGGVINIITKQPGDTSQPEGSIQASYGKKNSQDYRAELSGRTGSVRYYLFAGRRRSDGLRSSRSFDSDSLYSKFNIPVIKDIKLNLTMGYSRPYTGLGDFPDSNISSSAVFRTFFATASIDALLSSKLSLNLSLYTFRQKASQMNNTLRSGVMRHSGKLFLDNNQDEKTIGASARLVYEQTNHTAVMGADFYRGSLDQTITAGRFLRLMRVPKSSATHPDIDKWAIYANDTMVFNRLSVTPGIRYDYNSITSSFVSPSLGLTFRLDGKTILRASAARGFTIPPLSFTSGGGLFLDPNPSLDLEKVWSYQAGVESKALKYLWVKATLFFHDQKKAIQRERAALGPPAFNDIYINKGKTRRQGMELELETISMYNMTFQGGYSYVNIKPSNMAGASDIYSYNIGVRYDDGNSFKAQVFGHYVWWDFDKSYNADYNDFIWDITLFRKIYARKTTSAEIFFTARNIFNGSQYNVGEHKNPRRWMEIGMRFGF